MVLLVSLLIGVVVTVLTVQYFERRRGKKEWLLGSAVGVSFALIVFYIGLMSAIGDTSKDAGDTIIEVGELAPAPQGDYLSNGAYYVADGNGVTPVRMPTDKIGTIYYTNDSDAYYVRYGSDITNWVLPGFGHYMVPGTVDFYLPASYSIGGNSQTIIDVFQPRGNEPTPALLSKLPEQGRYYPLPCYSHYTHGQQPGAINTCIRHLDGTQAMEGQNNTDGSEPRMLPEERMTYDQRGEIGFDEEGYPYTNESDVMPSIEDEELFTDEYSDDRFMNDESDSVLMPDVERHE